MDATTPQDVPDAAFECAIVEVFGHRRHAGMAREEERFGAKMLRIDIPAYGWTQVEGQPPELAITGHTTHYYGGASIFSYTLTDEATVRRINTQYIRPPHPLISAPDDSDVSHNFDGEDL